MPGNYGSGYKASFPLVLLRTDMSSSKKKKKNLRGLRLVNKMPKIFRLSSGVNTDKSPYLNALRYKTENQLQFPNVLKYKFGYVCLPGPTNLSSYTPARDKWQGFIEEIYTLRTHQDIVSLIKDLSTSYFTCMGVSLYVSILHAFTAHRCPKKVSNSEKL